jgi:FixJ family two-component response regulator
VKFDHRGSDMKAAGRLVLIVDDDNRIREALQELMATVDLRCVTFASANEYLTYARPAVATCLLLDINLPDMSGLDLQALVGRGYHPPIIFITGCGDVPSSVRALKAGAVDFMTKPFRDQDLLERVHAALVKDDEQRLEKMQLDTLQQRFQSLTQRQREVMGLVVSGLLNKQAAARLGISEITVKAHRGRVMRRMKAASLADLVRMSAHLNPETRRAAA